jgi:glycerol-3-phosphate acyltransferase PlsX
VTAGSLSVALDAMGGDRAPEMVIRGANIARQRFPSVRYLFFGDERRISALLGRYGALRKTSEIRHTDKMVASDDKPSTALRAGRMSSMRLAIDAVQSGEAAAVVSAGNTGALMAMAKFVLRTLPGIDRPAIASFFPTLRGESVMLDLGANLSCDAENLVQFALMGNVFARTVLGTLRPTIGLLNVGSEEVKGHEAVREAAAILKSTSLPGAFHGFIEGDDIARGTVDVIVTDGFTGNVALKTLEGTTKLYAEFLRRSFKSSLVASFGYLLARPALNALRVRTDPRRYNGAIFLGLNGVAVKSHGGTDALGFANAIGVAVDMVTQKSLEKIREDFARSVGGNISNAQVVGL